MTPVSTDFAKERTQLLATLAGVLESAERGDLALTADQYRSLIRRLKLSLQGEIEAPALEAVLSAHPATAELYENLHYEHSGLLRSPIDQLVMSEWETSALLTRLAAQH